MNKRIAGAIIRVSTARQLEGTSPERQLEAMRALAEEQGYELADTHSRQIAKSGARRDRLSFASALTAAAAGNVSRLYVYSVDRLGRDLLEMLLFLRDLDGLGIECWEAERQRRYRDDLQQTHTRGEQLDKELFGLAERLTTLRERVDYATFEDKRRAVVELVKGIQIASEEIDGKNTAIVTITYRFDQVPGVQQGRGTLVPEETLSHFMPLVLIAWAAMGFAFGAIHVFRRQMLVFSTLLKSWPSASNASKTISPAEDWSADKSDPLEALQANGS